MKRKIWVTESEKDGKISYGVTITEETKTKHFYNLSENPERVESLCHNLQNTDISEAHIEDIIRDFIVEEACDRLIENSLR